MKFNQIRSLKWFLALLIFLTSCTYSETEHVPKMETQAKSSIPTETKLPNVTKTNTLISTNTPSPTKTLTQIPTNTPLPTWTALPTSDNLGPEIMHLMRTNKGCLLPCWWGITPGETSWQEAKQFLERIGVVEESNSRLSTQANAKAYIAFYWFPGTDYSNATILNVVDDIVQTMRVNPDTSIYSFQLNQILTEYGIPQDILVSQYSVDRTYEEGIYSIVLLYSEARFLAHFFFFLENSNDSSKVCLEGSPWLEMWSNDEDWTIEWIQENIVSDSKVPFRSIEEVSDFNVETFTIEFSDENSDNCFILEYH